MHLPAYCLLLIADCPSLAQVQPDSLVGLRVEDVDRAGGYLKHFESFSKGLALVGHVDFVIVGDDNLTAHSWLVHIPQNLERDVGGGGRRRDVGRR